MKVAIVILNWNGKDLLAKFLPSIIEYSSKEATIYVADNDSTDDSVSFLKNNFPTIKVIQNLTNGGYAKGYNDALQKIEADIYCLINSDVEVSENWLAPVIKSFKNDEKLATVQSKILDYKNKNTFEYAGAAGGFLDFFGYPYCKGRVFNTLEEDKKQYEQTSNIFWASGACFFVRSKVFHELNGFDEDYFAHQEEIDLCWRVQNSGYSIKYVPESKVYHVGGATLSNSNPRKTFLNFRNSLLNIVKNISIDKLFLVVLSRLILDGIAGIKFFFDLKPRHTFAVLRAHFSFYWYLPKFLNKRKGLSQKIMYYKHGSIVFQYFVLGRKKFDQLK